MEEDTANWRESLSFSQRFANVSKIAASIANSQHLSTEVARNQAKEVEKTIFTNASSLDDYNSNCIDAAEVPPLDESLEQYNVDDQIDDTSVSDVSIGKYTNAQHFRDGLFSFVYKARAPMSMSSNTKIHMVALKVTTPSMMEKPHDSEREARILSVLRHPHIVSLVDSFQLAGGRLVLVFPFLPYDLHNLPLEQMLDRKRIKSHLRDMFDALKFIHSHGCIHRDIKPSNILLKTLSGPAYLADFGIAWSPTDAASEPFNEKITDVGTTCYRPPELLFGNRSYGTSLDLWAAGCTVAEVENQDGETLFDSGDLGSELALIQSIFMSLGTPTLQNWPEAERFPDWGKMTFREYPGKSWAELLPKMTQNTQDLVKNLVRFESGERLTAAEALQHPYFTDSSS